MGFSSQQIDTVRVTNQMIKSSAKNGRVNFFALQNLTFSSLKCVAFTRNVSMRYLTNSRERDDIFVRNFFFFGRLIEKYIHSLLSFLIKKNMSKERERDEMNVTGFNLKKQYRHGIGVNQKEFISFSILIKHFF